MWKGYISFITMRYEIYGSLLWELVLAQARLPEQSWIRMKIRKMSR